MIAGSVVGAGVGALTLAALVALQLRRRRSALLLRAHLSRTVPNDTLVAAERQGVSAGAEHELPVPESKRDMVA